MLAGAYNENADAIALRVKVFGLTEKEARDQKASTYVGRFCLAGIRNTSDSITRDQYDAAQAYTEAYENVQRAVKSSIALASGTGGASGAEGSGYEQWCKRAITEWGGIQSPFIRSKAFTRTAAPTCGLRLITQ